MRNSILIVLLVVFSSCAVSRKVQYNTVEADISALKSPVSIAIWDQRTQIIDNSRKSDFVGYTRSAAGMAYPMGTKSGDPLAIDMKNALSNSIGQNHTFLTPTTNTNEQDIINDMKNAGTEKMMLLKLNEYHTDGYGKQILHYDIDVKILNAEGEVLESKNYSGEEHIGGSVMWGPGKFKDYMPEAMKVRLEEIFNDPEITAQI